MPGYERAELVAELKIVPDPGGEQGPQAQVEAGMRAAGDTGLAREAGPGTTLLAGSRPEVLDGLRRVVEAALDAGARELRVKLEVPGEAGRFAQSGG